MSTNNTPSQSSTRRVVIIHGWADDPTQGWINWLNQELKRKGVDSSAPLLPNARHPDILEQLDFIGQHIGELTADTVLVGHSLGVALILHYLSGCPFNTSILGIVLVAGRLHPKRDNWPGLPGIMPERIVGIAKRRICIYSDNDQWVEPRYSRELAQLIQAESVEDPGKGHFQGLKGCDRVPSILKAVEACLD